MEKRSLSVYVAPRNHVYFKGWTYLLLATYRYGAILTNIMRCLINYHYMPYTSIGHHISKPRCQILESDSAYNFSNHLYAEKPPINTRTIFWCSPKCCLHSKAQTFRLNRLVLQFLIPQENCCSFFVTMVPSIQENVNYPFIALIFH